MHHPYPKIILKQLEATTKAMDALPGIVRHAGTLWISSLRCFRPARSPFWSIGPRSANRTILLRRYSGSEALRGQVSFRPRAEALEDAPDFRSNHYGRLLVRTAA